MKAFEDFREEPQQEVRVVVEGNYMRISFDFEKIEPIKAKDVAMVVDGNSYSMESVVVRGNRSYGDIVNAVVTDRYPSDKMDAVRLNYELAVDASSGITEEKRSEYLAEYKSMQEWRTKAKKIAKKVVEHLSR